jgi:hypothetical protein
MSNVTENRPAVKSARKPRSKPARSLTVLEAPAARFDGFGAIRITEGKKVDLYLVAWAFEKLDGELNTVETYDVLLAGQESSCTCKGNTYCGHCRHVEALTALDARGQLPRLLRQKAVACNRCQRLVEAPGLCDACQTEDEYHSACDQAAEMEAAGLDPWDCPEADAVYAPAEADY